MTSVAFLALFWILMLVVAGFLVDIFLTPFSTSYLGPRLVSLDWSGYVVVSDSGNPQPVFSGVNGSWTIPKVTPSQNDEFSAVWIGIGGQLDDSLIQTGTEQDSINGTEAYSAWYELLPNNSVTITTINVTQGDEITAWISLVDSATNQWSIEITDLTNGESFQQSFQYDSSKLSAEWIVERPTVDSTLGTLANFGSATFTDSKATTSNATGTIKNFPFSQVLMSDRRNRQLVTVSPLNRDGSGFTVNYIS
jgi:hypothetical protein